MIYHSLAFSYFSHSHNAGCCCISSSLAVQSTKCRSIKEVQEAHTIGWRKEARWRSREYSIQRWHGKIFGFSESRISEFVIYVAFDFKWQAIFISLHMRKIIVLLPCHEDEHHESYLKWLGLFAQLTLCCFLFRVSKFWASIWSAKAIIAS